MHSHYLKKCVTNIFIFFKILPSINPFLSLKQKQHEIKQKIKIAVIIPIKITFLFDSGSIALFRIKKTI